MAEMPGEIANSLKIVGEKLRIAANNRPDGLNRVEPRLVAVSKLKPKEAIIEAYECGQRHFGENYVQELVDKGNDPEVTEKCPEIKWHFIGHLQKNKVNKLLAVPNLFLVESVDSEKLATALNEAVNKLRKTEPLSVMVQINTSEEANKSGIAPKDAASLVDHIRTNCPCLKCIGLMTIGAFDHDLSKGPNPDFLTLVKCREDVSKELNLDLQSIELSMGMSSDYEHAIELGSTNVRVGTTIFGSRS